MVEKRPILIGNISGSTGDRVDGMLSMLSGETIVDAVCGDWLSEVNLAWRAVELANDSSKGFEPGFLNSFKLALDSYLSYPRRLRIVVNAGALHPRALAMEIQSVLNSSPKGKGRRVAYLTGDNVLELLSGEERNLTEPDKALNDWMEEGKRKPMAANAYVGSWGIVEALNRGADIVICGRCTDASPVIGLSAWWHGWKREEFDKLARAFVAGHLQECGCYVTGGNFGGFKRLLPSFYNLSYPIVEIEEDGTAIVQKQPDQNGLISVDTVKTQFVYEIQGRYYFNPDAIADCRNITFTLVAPGKVRVGGVIGLPGPSTAKVAVMGHAGYTCEFSVYPTGLDIAEKVRSFEAMTNKMLDRSKFDTLEFQTMGVCADDPKSQAEATVELRVFAQAKDASTLTRENFCGPVLSNLLQGFPAFTPNFDLRLADPKPYLTYFPCLMPVNKIRQEIHVLDEESGGNDETVFDVPDTSEKSLLPQDELPKQENFETSKPVGLKSFGKTVKLELGRVVYARSGDKGPDVNIGFFFPEDEDSSDQDKKWDWLRSWLTTTRLRSLLGKDDDPSYRIERCEFPDIRAVHFVIHGMLGAGVTSTPKIDSLGKNVAEYLRARKVGVPAMFVKDGPVRAKAREGSRGKWRSFLCGLFPKSRKQNTKRREKTSS